MIRIYCIRSICQPDHLYFCLQTLNLASGSFLSVWGTAFKLHLGQAPSDNHCWSPCNLVTPDDPIKVMVFKKNSYDCWICKTDSSDFENGPVHCQYQGFQDKTVQVRSEYSTQHGPNVQRLVTLTGLVWLCTSGKDSLQLPRKSKGKTSFWHQEQPTYWLLGFVRKTSIN